MQDSFDFICPEEAKNKALLQSLQQEVDRHNRQVAAARHRASSPPGSLLAAIDVKETRASAVYLLRGVLGHYSRAATRPATRKIFVKALYGEINLKKTSQSPVQVIRNVLMKSHFSY